VITTGAHNGLHNVEVLEANKRNILVMTHAQAVGKVMKEFQHSIAVCGSHGKTTTTAFITHVLSQLKLAPGSIIGAAHKFEEKIDRQYIVVEADEYVASPGVDMTPRFMYLDPEIIVSTNIDFDHPDVYKNIDDVAKTFLEFFKKIEKNNQGKLIACLDNEPLKKVLIDISKDKIVTYGFDTEADLILTNIRVEQSKTLFNAKFHDTDLGVFQISLFGDHNVLNAGAVIATALTLHLDIEKVKVAMQSFYGAKRRFELIYQQNNTFLFDDYAHHPQEICSTIQAFRSRFPGQRIIVIFQPHTLSRTLALKNDFIESLQMADIVFITDIFYLHEKKTLKIVLLPKNLLEKILDMHPDQR